MTAPTDDQKNLSPDPIERMAEASCNHGELNQRLGLTWDNLNEEERQPYIDGEVAAVKALMAHFEEKGTDFSTPPQRGYLYGVVTGILEAKVLEAHEQRETDDRAD